MIRRRVAYREKLPAWRGLHALAAAVCLLFPWAVANSARAATLLELLNGGFVDAGNARFAAWQLTSLDFTAALGPDLSFITVTPLAGDPANPGIQFSANGQLSTTGVNALDVELRYQVQAINNGNSFVGHALALTGINFGGSGGVAYISQNVVAQSGVDLGPAVAIADHESEFFQFNAAAAHTPHLGVAVGVNIFLNGLAATDSINLSTFTQRFAQTGPTTLLGDFNQDKRVNGSDFLLWQRGGSPDPLSGQDLATWKAHFGEDIALPATAAPVPEPAALGLLLCGAAAAFLRRAAGVSPPCHAPRQVPTARRRDWPTFFGSRPCPPDFAIALRGRSY